MAIRKAYSVIIRILEITGLYSILWDKVLIEIPKEVETVFLLVTIFQDIRIVRIEIWIGTIFTVEDSKTGNKILSKEGRRVKTFQKIFPIVLQSKEGIVSNLFRVL